ncbi:hypothetical protein AMK14_26635 [Streptomyces sp. TSRI0445]|uniref:hypothetical protein n=1 Tax=Streptomyces TaxID=1883 RepID=UPI00095F55FB|nr:hypothetical protein [Streptomyces sp. TSRI0445]OKI65292.1 hypothetical protein AMK14_26635 [Streptomyces sp. TSRI0445]
MDEADLAQLGGDPGVAQDHGAQVRGGADDRRTPLVATGDGRHIELAVDIVHDQLDQLDQLVLVGHMPAG